MLKNKLMWIAGKIKDSFAMVIKGIKYLFNSWPKAFIGTLLLLACLYYPLGGKMSENIDKTSDYEFSSLAETQSQTAEAIAYLIDRETNQHLWTANLPFFFPAYCLDNMPNFQTGMLKVLSSIVGTFATQINCPNDEKKQKLLSTASNLLAYPPNVWLFDTENKLKTAPSSSSQYRKAYKKIKDLNNALKDEKCFWVRDTKNFAEINKTIIIGLKKTSKYLENEIREGNNSWFDIHADDVFYYNQGRIYAYMIILKKLGRDYKQVLMSEGIYQDWTTAIRALQNGTEIAPYPVLNGDIKHGIKANHLAALGYYTLKAQSLLMKIDSHLYEGNKNDN